MLKNKLLKTKSSGPPANVDPPISSPLLPHSISPHFTNPLYPPPVLFTQPSVPLWIQFYSIECRLNQALAALTFSSPTTSPTGVAAVYNPVVYAHRLHCQYLERFLNERPTTLFVGMNPGPWGMCQTGVPFGCVSVVRDWMRLSGSTDKPYPELPERPVTGLECKRIEQSGKKFWQLFQDIFGDHPDLFFYGNFVHNFCPLAFFHKSGRNITPAELKGDVRLELQRLCSDAFLEILELLSPVRVISVGRYVETRVQAGLKVHASSVTHLCMPHPSPRSLNNANWSDKAKAWLDSNNIIL